MKKQSKMTPPKVCNSLTESEGIEMPKNLKV
jgi:hypothetical protein